MIISLQYVIIYCTSTLNFVDQLNHEIHGNWYSMNIDKTMYSSETNKIKIFPLAVARKTEHCV